MGSPGALCPPGATALRAPGAPAGALPGTSEAAGGRQAVAALLRGVQRRGPRQEERRWPGQSLRLETEGAQRRWGRGWAQRRRDPTLGASANGAAHTQAFENVRTEEGESAAPGLMWPAPPSVTTRVLQPCADSLSIWGGGAELLEAIRREAEAKQLPKQASAGMELFYHNYRKAVSGAERHASLLGRRCPGEGITACRCRGGLS